MYRYHWCRRRKQHACLLVRIACSPPPPPLPPVSIHRLFSSLSCCGFGPGPNWIRIQSGQWIRTHKSRKKLRNFMFWGAGCSLLRAEGFFCNLDVLYGGLGIGKLYLFIQRKFIFFSCKFSSIFCHQNSGSGSVSNEYGSAICYLSCSFFSLCRKVDTCPLWPTVEGKRLDRLSFVFFQTAFLRCSMGMYSVI